MAGIAINGRFLAARQTGVQRTARELTAGLDQIAAAPDGCGRLDMELIAPRGAAAPNLVAISVRQGGALRGQAWEQIDLPRLARGRRLINLCNLAPLSAKDSIVLIHDAQVYLSPRSYSPAFVAWYRLALPQLGRRAAAIITVSDYSRRMLARFGVAAEEKISVIPNAADHMDRIVSDSDIVARLGLAPGRFAVAFASTQAHKNIAVLARAFATPALKDVRLVLVGAATRAALDAGGIPTTDQMIFAGGVSDAELRALYENACCLASPSLTEGFGLPALEAMYVGCPVVAAPCGAVPEVCGQAAIYADPHDPDSWAEAIARLAADRAAARALGEKCKKHAQTFSWRSSARALWRAAHAAPQA